jgi:hypothetical protein
MQRLDIDHFRDLQVAGFPEKQAEAVIRVIAERITGQVATKADLAELKAELKGDIQACALNLRPSKAKSGVT